MNPFHSIRDSFKRVVKHYENWFLILIAFTNLLLGAFGCLLLFYSLFLVLIAIAQDNGGFFGFGFAVGYFLFFLMISIIPLYSIAIAKNIIKRDSKFYIYNLYYLIPFIFYFLHFYFLNLGAAIPGYLELPLLIFCIFSSTVLIVSSDTRYSKKKLDLFQNDILYRKSNFSIAFFLMFMNTGYYNIQSFPRLFGNFTVMLKINFFLALRSALFTVMSPLLIIAGVLILFKSKYSIKIAKYILILYIFPYICQAIEIKPSISATPNTVMGIVSCLFFISIIQSEYFAGVIQGSQQSISSIGECQPINRGR